MYPGSGTEEDPYVVDWIPGDKNPYEITRPWVLLFFEPIVLILSIYASIILRYSLTILSLRCFLSCSGQGDIGLISWYCGWPIPCHVLLYLPRNTIPTGRQSLRIQPKQAPKLG
ncbi:hypothetical protein F5Y11DRAFT_329239 [Daldinia sp. FL1419]|nr:hypothetical protein F5Y11DRAFT_329239 [Daldinia sp. FL1419]